VRWGLLDDGEFKWKVFIVDECPVEVDDDGEACGCCSPPKGNKPGKLYVKGTLSHYRTKHTLLHEIIHAAEYAEDISIKDSEVDAIARYIVRLFALNPKLARFLSKKA